MFAQFKEGQIVRLTSKAKIVIRDLPSTYAIEEIRFLPEGPATADSDETFLMDGLPTTGDSGHPQLCRIAGQWMSGSHLEAVV